MGSESRSQPKSSLGLASGCLVNRHSLSDVKAACGKMLAGPSGHIEQGSRSEARGQLSPLRAKCIESILEDNRDCGEGSRDGERLTDVWQGEVGVRSRCRGILYSGTGHPYRGVVLELNAVREHKSELQERDSGKVGRARE